VLEGFEMIHTNAFKELYDAKSRLEAAISIAENKIKKATEQRKDFLEAQASFE
jgi:hypothetical protein